MAWECTVECTAACTVVCSAACMACGMYGGMYGGGMLGGLYGSSMYGMGLYGGMYGGMMGGMYGMGMYGGMMSPFGLQNMYQTIDTGTGLSYQVPFLQIAPMLGVAGLYNSLFPNLFNSTTSAASTVAASRLASGKVCGLIVYSDDFEPGRRSGNPGPSGTAQLVTTTTLEYFRLRDF